MTYTLDWYAPDMIAKLVYGERIDLNEITDSFSDIGTLVDDTEHPLLHVLLDLSQVREHPLSLNDLSEAAGDTLYKQGMGWLLTYGAKEESVKYVMAMLANMATARFRHFPTKNDALLFLRQMDRNIPADMLEV